MLEIIKDNRKDKPLDVKVNKNPDFWIDFTDYPDEIDQAIAECNEKINIQSKDFLKRTKFLSKQYPDIPELGYLLIKAFYNKELFEKAEEYSNLLYSKFPDYLFAKLYYALTFLDDADWDNFLEIIVDIDDIKKLSPERNEFHVDEIMLYYNLCAFYHIQKDDVQKANDYLGKMIKISADHNFVDVLSKQLIVSDSDFDEAYDDDELYKEEFYEENNDYEKEIQTDEKPEFIHPEIHDLYQYDYKIDKEIIKNILELPRKTLIKDLETVLIDSIKRYDYFRKEQAVDREGYQGLFFPIHASLLLIELKAEPSFHIFERIIKQGDGFIDYWFSESDVMHTILYQFKSNNIDYLLGLLKTEGIALEVKNTVITIFRNIALRQKGRRNEISNIYKKLIDYLIENEDNHQIFDYGITESIAQFIGELKFNELTTDVKYIFDNNLLIHDYYLDFDEFIDELEGTEDADESVGPIFTNIFDEYDYLRDILDYDVFVNPLSDKTNDDDFLIEDDNVLKIVENKKTGRNDPCHCGSGKKYKKCCMDR